MGSPLCVATSQLFSLVGRPRHGVAVDKAAAAMYQELAAAYEEIYPALKAGTRVFDGPLRTADRDASAP